MMHFQLHHYFKSSFYYFSLTILSVLVSTSANAQLEFVAHLNRCRTLYAKILPTMANSRDHFKQTCENLENCKDYPCRSICAVPFCCIAETCCGALDIAWDCPSYVKLIKNSSYKSNYSLFLNIADDITSIASAQFSENLRSVNFFKNKEDFKEKMKARILDDDQSIERNLLEDWLSLMIQGLQKNPGFKKLTQKVQSEYPNMSDQVILARFLELVADERLFCVSTPKGLQLQTLDELYQILVHDLHPPYQAMY